MTDFLRNKLREDGVNVYFDVDCRPTVLGSYFVSLPIKKIGTYIDACKERYAKLCDDKNEASESEKTQYKIELTALSADIDALYKDFGIVAKRMMDKGTLAVC